MDKYKVGHPVLETATGQVGIIERVHESLTGRVRIDLVEGSHGLTENECSPIDALVNDGGLFVMSEGEKLPITTDEGNKILASMRQTGHRGFADAAYVMRQSVDGPRRLKSN